MKTAKFLSPIALAAVLLAGLLAACGGGSSSGLKGDDVAVVGSAHVTKKAFDTLLDQAKRSYTQQGKTFPKQGTTEYETVKGQAVALLVQQAERTEKAKSEGINITDSQVEKRLNQIKKQYFANSEKKYKAQLKKQHLTDAQVHDDVRSQLISEAVFAKVTKDVKVSADDVHAYYIQHPQLYSKAQTRDVRHILVKTKTRADSIYSQLKAGNKQTWCTLAKKYSQDPSSKNNCGKLTISKGQTVAEFDKVAFAGDTNTIHAPVHNARYGWFVIEPISRVHPRSTTPEKQVAATIKQQLLQQKKNQAMTDWVSGLSKTFCSDSKIKYGVGYHPSPDPCASTTSTNTTT
jgi:parvulin-like peptidyl-prolyl isomerase